MEGLTMDAASNDIGASSSVTPPPPWIELPHNITANILQRLGVEEILESAQKVCMTWRNVCKADPSMWRKIHLHHYRYPGVKDYDTLCRHAVDCSQGQLTEITIGHFGTDMLLEYIAERSSQLRHLKLVFCRSVTGEAVIEAAKRLPLLETLYIGGVEISGESIEQVGRSCPLLKSLTLYDIVGLSRERHDQDDVGAFAIAKSMPELCHLHIVGEHTMTNNGLEAILDGCPRLESLYLDLCAKFDLGGELGERCSRQIKSLTILNDSTDYDSEFGYDHGYADYAPSDDYSDKNSISGD